jgi:hypothetical protein
VTIVAGQIDTALLLESLASELRAAAGFPGSELFSFDEIAKHLGDVTLSLMLSDRTGLLHGALISMEVKGDGAGGAAKLQVIYRLTSVNEPVKLPAVSD